MISTVFTETQDCDVLSRCCGAQPAPESLVESKGVWTGYCSLCGDSAEFEAEVAA